MWKPIVAARYEFSLFYAALTKCSPEVIRETSQPDRFIAWVAKDGWHHRNTRNTRKYGGRRQYYGGAMQLAMQCNATMEPF